LFALAILCSGEYCCRDQVVVDDGLWCEALFAGLFDLVDMSADILILTRVIIAYEPISAASLGRLYQRPRLAATVILIAFTRRDAAISKRSKRERKHYITSERS
jgi:hypothetical protein